jgi:hypothetical protein
MNFIKYFFGMTAIITMATMASLVAIYAYWALISFVVWELPNFYWSWGIFRGTVLFGVFFGVWFAIDHCVGYGETVKVKK